MHLQMGRNSENVDSCNYIYCTLVHLSRMSDLGVMEVVSIPFWGMNGINDWSN